MPTVSAERLMDISKALLQAAGASAEEAATIARYNIGANLVGHDGGIAMTLAKRKFTGLRIYSTCLSLVTDRAMEAWYHLSIA